MAPRWPLGGMFGSKLPPPRQPQVETTYHAVSIIPGEAACSAAYRFTGQRFLSRQAPRLPLPTCETASCSCRYKHHKDRRAGSRRRSDVEMMPGPYSGSERRRSRGRRAEDHYWEDHY